MNAATGTGTNEANEVDGVLTDPRALAWLRMRAIARGTRTSWCAALTASST